MKYNPELFTPPPGAKAPTDPSAYLKQEQAVLLESSKKVSKTWLYWAIALFILGLPSLFQTGWLLWIIAFFLYKHYDRYNAPYLKATTPLPYTPRS